MTETWQFLLIQMTMSASVLVPVVLPPDVPTDDGLGDWENLASNATPFLSIS